MLSQIQTNIFLTLLLLLFIGLSQANASEAKGVICLGENLAIDLSEHTSRLHMQIDDSDIFYFSNPYKGPRLVATELNINKLHYFLIYFDKKLVSSLLVDFSKTQSNAVLIWRAKGAWKIKSTHNKLCIQ